VTNSVSNISCVIGIAAGKGGVGKSTVTVNLATALVASGAKVGVLDADLYGPSISMMMGGSQTLKLEGQGIIPACRGEIFFVSLAQFPIGKEGAFVRAPIANQIITDFLEHVVWPELDYLLIDFPPGTGDIQLTIMQKAQLTGAILVTTPQEVALLDVAKALKMFQAMQVPILGVVENMSFFQAGEVQHYPLGSNGGSVFAANHSLPFLGELPLDPLISSCSDKGDLLLEKFPLSLAAVSYKNLTSKLFAELIQLKGNAFLPINSCIDWSQN
jgi:ATP-binding protein involved in chromosome partitioning